MNTVDRIEDANEIKRVSQGLFYQTAKVGLFKIVAGAGVIITSTIVVILMIIAVKLIGQVFGYFNPADYIPANPYGG